MLHTPILMFHILAGTVGMLGGFVAMAFRKGSRGHSVAGDVFVVSMLGLSLTGTWLAILKSEPGNILCGIITFYLVATAWRTARRKEIATDIFDWFGLVVVFGLAATEATLGMQAALSPTGLKYDYPPGPYFFMGSIAVLATIGDISMLVRGGMIGTKRIARHLWRMCFAWFIASASIFLARAHVFPAFMQKTGMLYLLSFLPIVLMIYWLIRVRFAGPSKLIAMWQGSIAAKKREAVIGTPARVLGLILFLAFAFPVIVRAQQSPSDDQVIRVNVELVQVDAQVTQKKTGRPVGSLSKGDFELYEDGERQQIVELSRDQLPLSVVLLFDLTFTVQPVLKPLAQGALHALEHLKPEDEVAVMVYAASAELLQDFTTDRERTVAAIEKASEMASGDEAYFNQAIFEAAEQLGKTTNPRSRRTIIWLTDNLPNIPSEKQHSEQDAFHEVYETGTVVSALLERSAFSDFALVLFNKNPAFAGSRSHNPPGDAYKYAERTGGDVMKSSKTEVSTKLAALIDEIRTRYTLGYYPSVKQEKGKFCEIKIQVRPEAEKRDGRMLVRTKTGYYR